MMKASIYILSVLIFTLMSDLSAQMVITQKHFPVPGDTLGFVPCDTIGILEGDSGSNVLWDFSNLKTIKPVVLQPCYPLSILGPHASQWTDASVLMFNEQVVRDSTMTLRNFYDVMKVDSTSSVFYGYKGRQWDMRAINKKTVLTFPFAYGSYFEDSYTMRNLYLYYFVSGKIQVTADAWGALAFGDTLYTQVLRTKIQDNYTLRVEVNIYPNTFYANTNFTITEYHWWEANSIMPVLRLRYMDVEFSDGTVVRHKHIIRGYNLNKISRM